MPISQHSYQHVLKPEDIMKLGRAFLACCAGVPSTTIEAACVFVYANVAPGVRRWPEAERERRANVFMKIALERLVDAIGEVDVMQDRDLAAVEAADRAGLRSTMGGKPS